VSGISCPLCGRSDRWQVLDSRPSTNDSIRRRRKCSCGMRITTYEIHIEQLEELRAMHDNIVEMHRLSSQAVKAATLFHERAKLAFRGASQPDGEPDESSVEAGDRFATEDNGEASPRSEEGHPAETVLPGEAVGLGSVRVSPRSDGDGEPRRYTMGQRHGPLSVRSLES
jgi:hypothetical protein